MADISGAPARSPAAELLSEAEVAAKVEALAERIAPRISDETVAVCLLVGGLWFAADLIRALARKGRHPLFDALWLSSYAEARQSSGQVQLRAPLQWPIAGRQVLLIDDVLDSGLSVQVACGVMRDAGAAEVLTAVFARKPWPTPRAVDPEFVAWEAPARFLVGYGMDDAGRMRGFPGVGAMD
jgi:hypoxanthine phosphoribosyltransferase